MLGQVTFIKLHPLLYSLYCIHHIEFIRLHSSDCIRLDQVASISFFSLYYLPFKIYMTIIAVVTLYSKHCINYIHYNVFIILYVFDCIYSNAFVTLHSFHCIYYIPKIPLHLFHYIYSITFISFNCIHSIAFILLQSFHCIHYIAFITLHTLHEIHANILISQSSPTDRQTDIVPYRAAIAAKNYLLQKMYCSITYPILLINNQADTRARIKS